MRQKQMFFETLSLCCTIISKDVYAMYLQTQLFTHRGIFLLFQFFHLINHFAFRVEK